MLQLLNPENGERMTGTLVLSKHKTCPYTNHKSVILLLPYLHKADTRMFISLLCVLFFITNKWKQSLVFIASYGKIPDL